MDETNQQTLATQARERYKVSIAEYRHYLKYGFVKIHSLLPLDDVKLLAEWADDLLYGREAVEGLEPASPDAPFDELLKRFTRIHMLHRTSPRGEGGLLLPRVLDVIEALIGPDVSALQSMLFFNPPGRGGQGWHQDAYYIPTYPDTLIGAWIPLEPADEENGCLWVVPESNHEPVYPPSGNHHARSIHNHDAFDDLFTIEGASHLEDESNTLSKVVQKYPSAISVPIKPGDVIFFHSHLLHRSYPNRTTDRMRRAYVCHYCNARSWIPWNHGVPFEGNSANNLHILARGGTHLPYAKPVFDTPVELRTNDGSAAAARMMGMEDGQMMEVKQKADSGETPKKMG